MHVRMFRRCRLMALMGDVLELHCLCMHAGRMTHFGTSAPLDIIFVTQINDSSKGPV